MNIVGYLLVIQHSQLIVPLGCEVFERGCGDENIKKNVGLVVYISPLKRVVLSR